LVLDAQMMPADAIEKNVSWSTLVADAMPMSVVRM
jgi:hypothetical protein